MSQKGLAPIVIVLLIAAAIGGYLIYQNKNKQITTQVSQTTKPSPRLLPNRTPDPFVNWKTYTNTKYSYSFRYPSEVDFIVELVKPEEASQLRLNDTLGSVYTYYGSDIHPFLVIRVIDPKEYEKNYPNHAKTANLELKTFAEEIWQKNKNLKNHNFPNKKIGDLIKTTFAGQEAHTFTLDSEYSIVGTDSILEIPMEFILSEYSGRKYVIRLPIEDQKFNQILSTFKFTD